MKHVLQHNSFDHLVHDKKARAKTYMDASCGVIVALISRPLWRRRQWCLRRRIAQRLDRGGYPT